MTNRDDRFDNLKGFLIFLVVCGHFFEQKVFFPAEKMPFVSAVCTCIYSFHMPAMVMISGYFSKQSADPSAYVQKQIRSLLIPFVVFDLLLWLQTSRNLADLLTPCFTMWYLLSLFFWRLTLPAVTALRFPLTLSLIFALLVGLTKASTLLSVSRTIAFFPFFLVGYHLRPGQLLKLRQLPKIVPILLLVLSLALVILLISNGVPHRIYHMKEPFKNLSLQPVQGLCLRSLVLAIGYTASLSLFALAPEKKTFLTGLGTRSITVYLAHGLVIRSILALKLDLTINSPALILLSAAAFSVAICLLFGNPFVARGFHTAMDWIGGFVLKRQA